MGRTSGRKARNSNQIAKTMCFASDLYYIVFVFISISISIFIYMLLLLFLCIRFRVHATPVCIHLNAYHSRHNPYITYNSHHHVDIVGYDGWY